MTTTTIAEDLRASMRRHWKAGLRAPQFHWAVRDDCLGATHQEFNAAAETVQAEFWPERYANA